MQRNELLALARRVLSIPTAPYHEHGLQRFVIEFGRGLGLRPQVDRSGNVIVRRELRGRCACAPVALVAHMDHPGFEALGGRRAEFLGGVPRQLLAGGRVRFHTRAGIMRAGIARVEGRHWPRRKLVMLNLEPRTPSATTRLQAALQRGDFGMWDVPVFQLRAGRLRAGAIDDVLGVAVVLATLAEVVRRRIATPLWGVFTRAEEVGFQGAMGVARAGVVPKNALVISMEMSRQRPWARLGEGPVVRVGDRMSVFDPQASWFIMETAQRARVTAQRALMDGGTCEATVFARFGYRVGGLCLALGNYHNVGRGMKPRAEYVSVSDLAELVRLTVAVAAQWRGFRKLAATFKERVLTNERCVPRRLLLAQPENLPKVSTALQLPNRSG